MLPLPLGFRAYPKLKREAAECRGRKNEREKELPILDNLGRILGKGQGRYSENGTRPEKGLCLCARTGTQANAGEESPDPGIWQREFRTQDILKVAGSGEKVRERGYTPHIRPCARKRRNWSAIQNFAPAVGLLKLHTLFIIAFASFWFALKRKPPLSGPYLTACAVIVWRKILHVLR